MVTTAAAISTVAAVGMGIGGSYYFASASASLLIPIVLAVLPYFENLIDKLNQSKLYTVQCDFSENKRKQYENIFGQYHLKFRLIKEIKAGGVLSMTWQMQGHAKNHQQFISETMKDETVKKFEY